MTVLASEHTARKTFKCSRCTGRILPGQRYEMATATPGDPDIGNKGWWRTRRHLDEKDCT